MKDSQNLSQNKLLGTLKASFSNNIKLFKFKVEILSSNNNYYDDLLDFRLGLGSYISMLLSLPHVASKFIDTFTGYVLPSLGIYKDLR